jgi:hypothetical protein
MGLKGLYWLVQIYKLLKENAITYLKRSR